MAAKVRKKYEIDMCEGPLLKKIFLFTLPLMASSLLQLLFNAADVIVVGRFAGDDSLAAVGSTSSLSMLLVNIFMGLSIGAGFYTLSLIGVTLIFIALILFPKVENYFILKTTTHELHIELDSRPNLKEFVNYLRANHIQIYLKDIL